MKLEYDKRHDAVYFAFSSADSTRQVKLDNARVVDYGADGSVVGVEFISPSGGMEISPMFRAPRRSGRKPARPAYRFGDRSLAQVDQDASPAVALRRGTLTSEPSRT